MFCSNCGSKLAPDVRFCTVCGAKVQEPSTSAPPDTSASAHLMSFGAQTTAQPAAQTAIQTEVQAESTFQPKAPEQPASLAVKVLVVLIGLLSATTVVIACVIAYFYMFAPQQSGLTAAERAAGFVEQESQSGGEGGEGKGSAALTASESEADKTHDPKLAPKAMFNDTLQEWHDAQATKFKDASKSNLADLAAYGTFMQKNGTGTNDTGNLVLSNVDVRKATLGYAYVDFPDNKFPGVVIAAVDESGNYGVLAVYRLASSKIESLTQGEPLTKAYWKITPNYKLMRYDDSGDYLWIMVYTINSGPVEAVTLKDDGTYEYTSWAEKNEKFEKDPQLAWNTLLAQEQPKIQWHKLSDFEPIG